MPSDAVSRVASPDSPLHAVPACPRSSVRKHPLYSVCGTKDLRTPHILSIERANTPSFLQGLLQTRRRTWMSCPDVSSGYLVPVSQQVRCKVRCSLASARDGRQLVVDCPSRHATVFPAWRHRTSHVRRSISGLIPQFIAEDAARFLPLHQFSAAYSSCYFVIVPASAIADTSNATLKTRIGSVNTVGFNRRVQFASPFPKANYHRNRS
jgi:hypothetical protein